MGDDSVLGIVIRPTFPSTRCPTPSIRPPAFWPRPTPRRTPSRSRRFPIPLTHEWVDPYRVERIYKLLEGRDHLTPADMLAVQTDVYSEVDQELGHRFAYAIDHTPSARRPPAEGRRPDARLGWPADHRFRRRLHRHQGPLRPLAADSGAQAGQGDRRRSTTGPSPTLPRKRSSCTPAPTGFRRATRTGTSC